MNIENKNQKQIKRIVKKMVNEGNGFIHFNDDTFELTGLPCKDRSIRFFICEVTKESFEDDFHTLIIEMMDMITGMKSFELDLPETMTMAEVDEIPFMESMS